MGGCAVLQDVRAYVRIEQIDLIIKQAALCESLVLLEVRADKAHVRPEVSQLREICLDQVVVSKLLRLQALLDGLNVTDVSFASHNVSTLPAQLRVDRHTQNLSFFFLSWASGCQPKTIPAKRQTEINLNINIYIPSKREGKASTLVVFWP